MKNQKGITLIALIITIILMLILVVVTINVALSGELFGTANKASKDTQRELDKEELFSGVASAYDAVTGNLEENKLKQTLGLDKWTVVDNGDGTFLCTKILTRNAFKVEKSTDKIVELSDSDENNHQTPIEPQEPGETTGKETEEDNIFVGKGLKSIGYDKKDGLGAPEYFRVTSNTEGVFPDDSTFEYSYDPATSKFEFLTGPFYGYTGLIQVFGDSIFMKVVSKQSSSFFILVTGVEEEMIPLTGLTYESLDKKERIRFFEIDEYGIYEKENDEESLIENNNGAYFVTDKLYLSEQEAEITKENQEVTSITISRDNKTATLYKLEQ